MVFALHAQVCNFKHANYRKPNRLNLWASIRSIDKKNLSLKLVSQSNNKKKLLNISPSKISNETSKI